MMKISALSILFLLLLSSCYYDTDEALFPQLALKACDTTVFTYTGAIQPIISGYCISCHASQVPTLNSYQEIFDNASSIYSDIKIGKMPKTVPASKLEDCQITQFRKWMDAGMPNN